MMYTWIVLNRTHLHEISRTGLDDLAHGEGETSSDRATENGITDGGLVSDDGQILVVNVWMTG